MGLNSTGRRSKEIKIRLTDDEHAGLKSKAGKMRLACWMRESCLSKMPSRIPTINIDALAQLRGVAGNLNQLAKLSNSGKFVELSEIQGQVSELRAILAGASQK